MIEPTQEQLKKKFQGKSDSLCNFVQHCVIYLFFIFLWIQQYMIYYILNILSVLLKAKSVKKRHRSVCLIQRDPHETSWASWKSVAVIWLHHSLIFDSARCMLDVWSFSHFAQCHIHPTKDAHKCSWISAAVCHCGCGSICLTHLFPFVVPWPYRLMQSTIAGFPPENCRFSLWKTLNSS